MMQVLHCSIRL